MRKTSTLVIVAVAWILATHVRAAPLVLAENGGAKADILLPTEPTAVESFAASAMAETLKKMTGATFAVVKEDKPAARESDGAVISIGRTSHAASVKIQGPAWKQQRREAFRILRRDNVLIIAGNPDSPIADQGALWGIYTFLEMQGVGSYLPDSSADVFPNKPTLSIDEIDLSDAPWFEMRGGGNVVAGHLRRYQPGGDRAGKTLDSMELFSRMGTARNVDYNHMWQYLITPQVRKDHPEWFNQTHNPRYGPSPAPSDPGADDLDAGICLSNPEIRNLFIEHFRKRFSREPELYGATICADDYLVGDRCDCAECQRLMSLSKPPTFTVRSPRSASDLYVDFLNAVAGGLEKEFPDRKLIAYAYLDTIDPPTKTRLHPNVIMMIAPLDSPDEMHPAMDAIARGWREMGAKELYWYGYILTRPPVPRLMGEWFRNYRKLNIDGVYLEFAPNVGAYSALNAWMQAKLMWNPDADVSELVDQYCTGLFGAEVGNLMRRFFFAWEAEPPFADEDIPSLLAVAEEKAGGPTTGIGHRVRMFKLGYELQRSAIDLDHALKLNDLQKAADAARGGIAADKALKEEFPAWVMKQSIPLLNYASAAGYSAAVLPALERAMKDDAIKPLFEAPLSGAAVCVTNNADLPSAQRRDIGATVTYSPSLSSPDPKGARLFDGRIEGIEHSIENSPYPSIVIDIDLHQLYQIERVETCTGMNVGAGSLMQIETVPLYIDIEIGNDGHSFVPVHRVFPRTLRGYTASDRILRSTRFVRLVTHSMNMGHDINEVRIWARSKKQAK